MLTRLDASWQEPIRVVAVPTDGLAQGLLFENDILTVALEPEDALAVTLDDGTHAAATGAQVPVTWNYVVSVTLRGAVVPDAAAAGQSPALDLVNGPGAEGVDAAGPGRARRGRRRAEPEPVAPGAHHPVFERSLRQDRVAISPETALADTDLTITAATLERQLSQELASASPVIEVDVFGAGTATVKSPDEAPVGGAEPDLEDDVEDDATITIGAARAALTAEPGGVDSGPDEDATVTRAHLISLGTEPDLEPEPDVEPELDVAPEPDVEPDPDSTVTVANLARLVAQRPVAHAPEAAPVVEAPAQAGDVPGRAGDVPAQVVDVPESLTRPRSGLPSVAGSSSVPSDRDAEIMDATILGYNNPASLSLPTLPSAEHPPRPAANAVPAANHDAAQPAVVRPAVAPHAVVPPAAGTGGRPSAGMLAAAAALAAEQAYPPAPLEPNPVYVGPGLRISDTAGEREIGIDATLVLGRNPSIAQVRERDARAVSVFPTGGGVSHTHVSVRVQSGTVLVRDLWSTNGTRVKGYGIPPFRLRDGEEVPVTAGTVVELGDGVRLEITVGGGALGA